MLLECFIVFLRCIEMSGLASDSGIYEALVVHIASFLPNTPLKFQAKYQILSTISEHRKRGAVLCYEERHPMLHEWSTTVLSYKRMVEGATDSIYGPLIFNNMSFL